MYQCQKCKCWIDAADDFYSHACIVDTLQRIAAKVAEHKDPDYQLAKAAFTVLRTLSPKPYDPAFQRVHVTLQGVSTKAFMWGNKSTVNLTPRRRWRDKKDGSNGTV